MLITEEAISSSSTLEKDIIYGELVVPGPVGIVVFSCQNEDKTITAQYYFKENEFTPDFRAFEKYFSPMQCKMEAPVHSVDQDNAIIETKASCDKLALYTNFTSFYLGGMVIRNGTFTYLASSIYFNTTYEEKNGSIKANIVISKEQLKAESFLLDFTLSVDETDELSPLSRQDLEYEYPKTFDGKVPNVPRGVLALFADPYGRMDNEVRAVSGSNRSIFCAALGDPLPVITIMKGNKEISGVEQRGWREHVITAVKLQFLSYNNAESIVLASLKLKTVSGFSGKSIWYLNDRYDLNLTQLIYFITVLGSTPKYAISYQYIVLISRSLPSYVELLT